MKLPARFFRLPKTPILLYSIAFFAFVAGAANTQLPRAEHPRPDAYRSNWFCLNGKWEFEIDDNDDGMARRLMRGKDLSSEITVPFCPESKLSGLGHYGLMKHTWYRRTFDLPTSMSGKRVLLHFGAVDYEATVYVNGRMAGSHIGGSVPFAFDVTKFLRDDDNELVVHVLHDVTSGKEPTGKQTHTVSEGCVYTRTTGIWQPVWLEAVGSTYIEDMTVTPDPDRSRVLLTVFLNGNDPGLKLSGEAFANGRKVGSDSTPVTGHEQHLIINLSKTKLWEPGAPFLYDLKLSLHQGEKSVDELSSYCALRTVSVEGRCILINGKRVFQRLILDQGFYPDGIWTAPSDAELKADIERSMAAGFNGARLHQKVFEPRYLYWADKLGYLVWDEFPNWGFDYKPENYANYIQEWTEEVQRDRNHPCIIGWCPFNETGKEAGELQQIIWRQTKALDPSRPIIESSGWAHTLNQPEVLDDHDYNQDPAAFGKRWMNMFEANQPDRRRDPALSVPFMISEFGGIGWATEGGWGYGNGPKTMDEFYTRYEGLTAALLDNPNLFGFCYTQLTDVEQEHNGLYYYDRRPKFDLQRLHAATSRPAAYEITGPTMLKP